MSPLTGNHMIDEDDGYHPFSPFHRDEDVTDNNDDDDITGITNTPEDSEEDEHTGKETRKTS